MGAYELHCMCPNEECKERPMRLWQVKFGVVDINTIPTFGIWLYVWCDDCGTRMMADFMTQKAIFEWRKLQQEIPLVKGKK